ncbi:MAG: TRAP transporter large permease [Lachnospiraceae bacterium]|nr:TRAP transporter large permease [Lachnospiraceae bacterium]
MSPLQIGFIGLLVFIIIMCLGVPIPFSMLLVGSFGCLILKDFSVARQIIVSELTTNFTSYSMTVGAMFGVMGFLANYTGVGAELFDVAEKFIGHLRGGLAMATQLACAAFGAICGSPPATIGAFSAIAYPPMKKKGYDAGFAGAAIASGAQLSTIIPPSGTFIIYCLATNTSVGKMFISGVIPGILLCLMNCVAIYLYLGLHPEKAPKVEKATKEERRAAVKNGSLFQVLFVFLFSMGGMFVGLFTPSEAGAVGALGMTIVTIWKKQFSFKKLFDSCIEAAKLQCMVLTLISFASVFSKFVNLSTIPTFVGGVCQNLLAGGMSHQVLAICIIIMFFILGMFVDLVSVVVMTVPIFYPIIVTILGYSPLWFGVVITLLICLGGITPPVGVSVFMLKNACRDEDLTIANAFSCSWPYFFTFLIMCMLLIFFPAIVTWLPSVLFQNL